MVVTSSVGLRSPTGIAQGLNALPLTWRARLADVDAAAVLGAGDAEDVAEHPQQADVVGDVDGDLLAVERNVCSGTSISSLTSAQQVRCRPLVGDGGIGGTVGLG